MDPETFVKVRKFNCICETIQIQSAYTFFTKKNKLEVMTHNGYAPIKNISCDAYNENLFLIHCNRGIITLAESANLVTNSLDLISPIYSLNADLLHIPVNIDQSLSRQKCCTLSTVAAEWQFQNIYNPVIFMDLYDTYHVESATKDLENKVFLIEQIPNISNCVYSIELENDFHQAGIGNLIIKSSLKNT